MAIWEYRRADEEMRLVEAEVQGLIGQLGKRIDAIAAAVEQHKQKLLNQEAPAQELPRVAIEQLNQDPMEIENLEGSRSSGQHIGSDAPQGPDSMMLDDPPRDCNDINNEGVAAITSSDRNFDWSGNMTVEETKARWLEMCMRQVDAREATEAESSIAFLGKLMDEMHGLRGAAAGILTQITSNTIANEEEIAQQQAAALIEEFTGRDQAQDDSNDEEGLQELIN
jgi:hypothetical protein